MNCKSSIAVYVLIKKNLLKFKIKHSATVYNVAGIKRLPTPHK